MTSWVARVGAITLFVEDLAEAKSFYETAFGLPVYFSDDESVVFNFGNTLINLLKVTAADDLIGPATVGDGSGGARAQFTLDVEDVDAVCEQLKAVGVEIINGPIDRPWGVRTACFSDPAGHIWEIAK